MLCKKRTSWVYVAGICIVSFLYSLNYPSIAHAGNWFSKFVDAQIVTNSANSWNSQTRGYFSGGGFTMRLPSDSSPLFNVQAPKITPGCGGIDVFFGSFSFLDPEMLVKKLKNIMMAAAAYAFKLAISKLCESCSAIMDTLENIANLLNQMAINDCQTGEVLGKKGAEFLGLTQETKTSEGDSDGGGSSWLKDTLEEINKDVNDIRTDYKKMLNDFYGCNNDPACLKKVTVEGCLWDMVLSDINERMTIYKYDKNTINLLRAIFGDVCFYPFGPDPNKNKWTSGVIQTFNDCPESIDALINALTTVLPSIPTNDDTVSINYDAITLKVTEAGSYTCKDQSVIGVIGDNSKILYGVQSSIAYLELKKQLKDGKTSQTPSDSVMALVNESSLPVYQIINLLLFESPQNASTKDTLSEEETNVIKYIAIDRAAFLIQIYTTQALGILNSQLDYLKSNHPGMSPLALKPDDIGQWKSSFTHTHATLMNKLFKKQNELSKGYEMFVASRQALINVRRVYMSMLSQKMMGY